MRRLINYLGFQAGWFACILGAAAGYPWLGAVVVTAIVAAHLAWNARRVSESLLIGLAAALGYIADSVLALGGCLQFEPQTLLGAPSPIWMVALWANFAATLRWSLAWLDGRYAAGALLGALGGPLAYYAGARLGAVSFENPAAGLIAVAAEWAIATPLLLAMSRWTSALDGGPEHAEEAHT